MRWVASSGPAGEGCPVSIGGNVCKSGPSPFGLIQCPQTSPVASLSLPCSALTHVCSPLSNPKPSHHIPALPPFSQPAESLPLARHSLVFIYSAPFADSHAGAFQGRAAIGEAVSGGPEGRSSGGTLVSHALLMICPHSPVPALGAPAHHSRTSGALSGPGPGRVT